MKVTAKIKLDLRSPNYGSSVYAIQGDGDTRYVEAALLDGGKPWEVPAGVTAAVGYRKPDHTKGLYDKLADSSPAVTVSGSTVTVVLARQMLTVPGTVQASIVFHDEVLNQLTTFPFTVEVAYNIFAGAEPSQDYIRLQWLEDKLDEYLKLAKESGVFDGPPGKDFTYEDFTPEQLAALKGKDGYTPVKGVDYYTPAEIAQIKQEVTPQKGTDYFTPEDVAEIAEKATYTLPIAGPDTLGGVKPAARTEGMDLPVGVDSNGRLYAGKDPDIATIKSEVDRLGIVNDASGAVITLDDASDSPLQGLTVYGKTKQITTTGAQLLDFSTAKNCANASTGVAATINGDGSYTLTGTSIGNAGNLWVMGVYQTQESNPPILFTLPAGTYTVSGIILSSYKTGYGQHMIGKSGTFTLLGDTPITAIRNPTLVDGHTYNDTIYPMLCKGDTLLPWEPYTGGMPSPSPEYPQELVSAGDSGSVAVSIGTSQEDDNPQILALSTPNGLPGIPVASGGNYTDADGQQWIANYRDWGRGVDVQCVGRIESYAGEQITTQYMSTTGQLSDGATVLYLLPAPIETPIPADALAAYAALHTNKLNTTICNDAGAHMDVQYTADTKLYIDKKISALAAAIVNNA